MNTKKTSLDPTLEKYYSEGKEKDRLAACLLEKDRTLKILKRSMPLPPAIVLDIGGAAGAYAFPLADQGYEVHLIDPISLHIEQAQEYARNTSNLGIGLSAGTFSMQGANGSALSASNPGYVQIPITPAGTPEKVPLPSYFAIPADFKLIALFVAITLQLPSL